MKWRREIDYHGSRSYGADTAGVGLWSAVTAWLANIAARKALKRAARQTLPGGLPRGTYRGFSLIGASSHPPKHDTVDCPFPLKSGASTHGRDWRVLP